MTTPQYVFGPGAAWITPTFDYLGNAIVNPAPVLVAAVQDVGLDISAEVKELYGTNAFAIDIAGGKQKLAFKIKNGQVHGRLWNQMFFGQTLAAGIYDGFLDNVGTPIPSTPFQITPVTTYTALLPAGATFGYDLGVRDVNNLPYQRVASGPTTGQYSLTGGVYLFATADVGKIVYISFNYTATSTVAQSLLINNVTMGAKPKFQLDLKIGYGGNNFNATFYTCVSTKLSFSTKLDDYTYPEFDVQIMAPGSSPIGKLSWSN